MEKILEKQNMDAVKELANTSMKISEAKNTLFTLQKEQEDYIKEREVKVIAKVNEVLKNSKDLLDKAHQNYEEIHIFCQTISEYADFLSESQTKFQDLLDIFEKRNELWDKNIKKINQEIADQRQFIKQDYEAIKAREKRADEIAESLKKERTHIESQRTTLLASYNLEKELFNKLTKKSNE